MLGNVIGSNVFNILLVLGACGTLAPDGVEVSDVALHFDIPVMVAVALAIVLNLFHLFHSVKPSEADLLRE